MPASAAESILAAFQEFDKESSGLIQRADLKTVLKAIDEDMWNDEAVDSLFASLSPRSAGDADTGVPYRAFVASVFAAGDSDPLALAIPKSAGKSTAIGGALREQLSALNARLMRLTAGAGKEKAESLAALAARVEEHAAKGGGSRDLPKAAASRAAPAASYISEAFACYDVDSSGYLDIGELAALAKELGVTMDKSELERMFKAIDTAGNNQISFPEFCAFMNASEVTGSVSRSLRMKLWTRKFDRAAKSLRDTMQRQGGKGGKVESEAGELGELVLQLGGDMGDPALRLKLVGTWEQQSSEVPPSEVEIATTLKLRLAPPAGLQERAAQMDRFLQELVEGPPPGWESASIGKVEGSNDVEVSLVVKLPVPPPLAHGKPPPNLQSAGRYELELGAAVDLQKLARATEEAPYDVTADARLSAKVSASLANDSVLDNLYAFFPMAPDPDEPEEEWRPEARMAKYILPALARWLLQARGTVNLADLAPVLAALCDCRGFGDTLPVPPGRVCSLDKLFPDLRKVTAADVRTALTHGLVDGGGHSRTTTFSRAEDKKWEHWAFLLSARTILMCIGFTRGATVETITPYGTSKVVADVSGLFGLHSLVPSYQDVKRELAAQEAAEAERRKNRPAVGDRVRLSTTDENNGLEGEIIQDDMDSQPYIVSFDNGDRSPYLTEDQVQKLEGATPQVITE